MDIDDQNISAEPPGGPPAAPLKPGHDGGLDTGKSSDEQYLESLGYKQELNRKLGTFASFAVLFSIIGVSISIYTLFGYGLATAGPFMVGAFIVGGALQMIVGLSIAELVSAYPIAGGGYQIVNRIRGGVLAWQTGWLLVIALVVSVATNGVAIAPYISPRFGWGGSPSTHQTIAIALGLIVLITIVNIVGVQFSSLVNNLGVLLEICGLSVIVLLLLFKGTIQPISFLKGHGGTGSGTSYILPFLYAFLFPVYMINAFDSTGHVGEETHDAAVRAPKGAVIANFSAYIYAVIAIVILLLSIPNLPSAVSSSTPIVYIVQSRLGSGFADALTVIVVVSFFIASQMLQLTATRIFWAQARDRQMPFSGWLRSVDRHGVPRNATLLTAVVAAVLLQFTSVLSVLAAMVALAFSVANVFICGSGLWGKYKGIVPKHPWHYGKLSVPFDIISILWSAALVGIILYQNPSQTGKGFAYVVIAGILIYYIGVKPQQRKANTAEGAF